MKYNYLKSEYEEMISKLGVSPTNFQTIQNMQSVIHNLRTDSPNSRKLRDGNGVMKQHNNDNDEEGKRKIQTC